MLGRCLYFIIRGNLVLFYTQHTEDFFISFRRLIFPINIDNTHWVFLVCHMRLKKLVLCDSDRNSMEKTRSDDIFQTVLEYLRREAIDKLGLTLAELSGDGEWSLDICGDFPQQDDSSSCGVFVIIGIECAALGIEPMVNIGNVDFFRKRIANDFLSARLD